MAKPTLDGLRAFAAIATHNSFRRAADHLGVSHSSLSLGLKQLESELGVRLFHRTTRSVSLTEAGEQLQKRLNPVLHQLEQLLGDISAAGGQPTGRLRINGSEPAIRVLLQRVVPRFTANFPGMELDLVAEGQLVDIVEQGFDAGVRLGEAVPRDMIAVRLSEDMRFLAVCAPHYLAGRELPATPEDLLKHQCIRQRLPSGKRYRWEFSRHGQTMAIDVPGNLTLDNIQLMIEAAHQGLGIAYVPELSVRQRLDEGKLVSLLEDWSPCIPGLFLYFPANRHMPAGLRAFIDLAKTRD
ncbi:LysR family transcriptional regulator [Biostraticola tofi]|uniref:LysR family transcriptional regulator n=1 Tax=Biostraticola tofi TaxID=466109 RepID=A0A4R3YKC0_9GAMM|nr:LysR family transcriptional regulator [Biostraticola tofi]TCV92631.1 LysR family transcriptional regulator [Biostraticola tofi]